MKETPKPTRKEINRLYSRLRKEVDRVYGKDDDGDSHATVEVHDKRDGHMPYIQPVPHIPFRAEITSDVVAQALNAALTNARSTAGALESVRHAVESMYRHRTDEKLLREIAESVFGKKVAVGEAYSRYDDAPSWSAWHLYKVHDPKYERESTSYFQSDRVGTQEGIKSIKSWLSTGKKELSKKHTKIDMWYVRTGEMGLTLAALVKVPEEERPKRVAANRARREFLEKHAATIQAEADRIETLLREKKTL